LTPSATSTATASRTATVSVTSPPSATPTLTWTPRPLNTATFPPPSATPTLPPPAAPVFADTPIWPFDAGQFIDNLDRVHKSFQNMTAVVGVAATSGTGSCHSFRLFSADWTSAYGFVNVPEAWYPLYAEYRVLLQQAFTLTEPIRAICAAGGGTVSPEAIDAMNAFFDPAQNRMYALLTQARAMR
jgi:hypothetical protein